MSSFEEEASFVVSNFFVKMSKSFGFLTVEKVVPQNNFSHSQFFTDWSEILTICRQSMSLQETFWWSYEILL